MCAEAREVRALKAYRMRAKLQCCRAGAMRDAAVVLRWQDLLVTGGEEGINGQADFAPDAAPIRRGSDFGFARVGLRLSGSLPISSSL